MIGDWLGWMEGLMVYGSIRHEKDKQNAGQVRARFGGPLPLGSLKGQPEKEYQQLGLGKFRSMRVETEQADHEYEEARKAKGLGPQRNGTPLPSAAPATQFTVDGEELTATAATAEVADTDDDDPPF